MELVTGALPSLLPKLGNLLVGEYKLQKGVKGEIMFLQAELESMKVALEKLSEAPADQLDKQDKIWARDVRELSYDIEDSIDTFVVLGKGNEQAKGFKKYIDRSLDLLTRYRSRHKIASEIRDIKRRVVEVNDRRQRYKIDSVVAQPVKINVDPRLLAQYTNAAELVGIDEVRDEVIKMLVERKEICRQQDKIISVVGFGELGKTTLANAVYQKLRAQFDCSAFVSVTQNPEMDKVFQDLFYQLAKRNNSRINVIDEISEFLQSKRYFIVLDDIWDISVWKMIRCALPDNICGYRIITTTRSLNVAEQVGGAYKLKPLCLHNSRILLHRRIFGNEDKVKCPDEQLADVSNRILRKCAGVPLAIITIASLLSSKGGNKIEWFKVYNSIGTGLENSLDVKNMRRILLLSYYDLPSHLRTCLLYLSVFPEDYEISKDRLIWMWIAEGFIQCENQGESLFDLGESYFSELINRSIIQPSYQGYSVMIEHCRVHGMVHDLICSLANEENFVTILNDVYQSSATTMVRRLSLQNSKIDQDLPWTTINIQQVRSVLAFQPNVNLMPTNQSFRVLRVLEFQNCQFLQLCSLKHIANLFHLRYLGLRKTCIAQLPEEIGNLQFLQTLDVSENGLSSLPSTIVRLRRLMCLRIDILTRAPKGIRNLTSLEELSMLCIDDSTDIVEELGHLTEMRILDIVCRTGQNNSLWKSLLECLCKLRKVQALCIMVSGECNMDAWVAPRCLRRLELPHCWFSVLPAWMNPSLLLNLSFLSIAVRKLLQEDIEILGRLSALRFLNLVVGHGNLGILGKYFFGAGSFPCLVECDLKGFIGLVGFELGAMPRLESVCFPIAVQETIEITDSSGRFNLGLQNLPSLQHITIYLLCGGASKGYVEEVQAVLRHATEIHSNHPTLEICL